MIYSKNQVIKMLKKANQNADFDEILKTEKPIELLTGEELWQQYMKTFKYYHHGGGWKEGAQYCINTIINKANETV